MIKWPMTGVVEMGELTKKSNKLPVANRYKVEAILTVDGKDALIKQIQDFLEAAEKAQGPVKVSINLKREETTPDDKTIIRRVGFIG